jgi:hypothetical protein
MGRHRLDTDLIPRVEPGVRRRGLLEFARQWFRGESVRDIRAGNTADSDQRSDPTGGRQDSADHHAESELLDGRSGGDLRSEQEDILRGVEKVGEFSEVVLERYIQLSRFVQARGLEEEFKAWLETSRSRAS